jgi:hypothetical protein
MDTTDITKFYNENKAAILKLVATEHLSQPLLTGLKYEFTALSGNKYYSFPENMGLPIKRYAKVLEHFDWLKNGISPQDFDQISQELSNCLAHIRAKTKDANEMSKKAGLLLAELDRRRAHAFPYYILHNLVADVLIREDENPNIISSQIHAEKCDEIEAEIEAGRADFFLTLPQLKPLNIALNSSPEELIEYLRDLRTEGEKDAQMLSLYLSWSEQERGTQTLKEA